VSLQHLIDELREATSFTPFGAVAGAHSYPGPEVGKLQPVGPMGVPLPDEIPKKVLKLAGHYREKIRRARKWRQAKQ
jgi:hypothetical protein